MKLAIVFPILIASALSGCSPTDPKATVSVSEPQASKTSDSPAMKAPAP